MNYLPTLFRFLLTCVFLCSLFPAFSGEKRPVSGAAWLVEWDLAEGLREADFFGADLAALQVFAVSFDADDQLLVNPKLADWLTQHKQFLQQTDRKVLLTIVNDVYREDAENVLKDTELITRLMATPESREKHKRVLLDLLDTYGLDGLDMDYEKVAEKDWPVYLEFCRDLYEELSAKGKTLRVVVEPGSTYFKTKYPKGPEYVVMAYNLFGFHTAKGGPKCDMKFISKLAGQRRKTGVDFRLALSLGGFIWRKDGKTSSLTEVQAVELAEKHQASCQRDSGSAYQHFTFTDESGTQCEVWYADAQTLLTLMRTATGFGFTGIDLWRLGGIAKETLEALKNTFSSTGGTRYVGAAADNAPSHTTISAAIQAAKPGDTIIVSPGEYKEDITIDKPGLTIQGDVRGDSPPEVMLSGTGTSPIVTDSANTLWRGISFSGGSSEEMVLLDSFSGRFEHCVFDLGKDADKRTILDIYGGSPTFQACRFLGDGGSAMVLAARTFNRTLADFTYCLFDGFADGLAVADENIDLRFANCLFTNNGILFDRQARFNGNIDIANSVLYFNKTAQLATSLPEAKPIRLTNCLYTPQFNEYLWITDELLERQPGVQATNCLVRAPGFTRTGKQLNLNIGIDDTINATVWEEVCDMADKYGIKVSLAVNTAAITGEDIEIFRRTVARGHEVGSHTADHLAVQPDPPLSIGYLPDGANEVLLTILPGEEAVVRADGQIICSIPLTAPGMNVNALSAQLRKAGIRTKVSFYHGGTPVHLLSPVSDLDIAFPQPVVPLYTDNLPFIRHELTESLNVMRTIFPNREKFVFMCPFGVNSEAAKNIMEECGYFAGRSAVDSGTIGWVEKGANTARLDIYNIPSSSFQTARTLLPNNNLVDNVLLTLEFLKRHFSVYSIYSHTWKELKPTEWEELLEVLSKDPQLKISTLQEMAESVTQAGTRETGNIYRYVVDPGYYDYRPAEGSPLLKAGEDLGLAYDFSGQPIPPGVSPNIGLYQ